MTNVAANRGSDSFYRFAVGCGLLLGIFALAWGRWNLGSAHERLFAVDEQQILARKSVDEQRMETERISGYEASLRRSMAAEKDRSSHHYFFLSDEADRTNRRLQHAQLELNRRQDLANMRSRRATLLQRQTETDVRRSDALAVLGLTLTVTGLFLWYLRRQRPLDAALREDKHSTEELPGHIGMPWDEVVVWSDSSVEDENGGSLRPLGGARRSDTSINPS